jgi:hypothetical protein
MTLFARSGVSALGDFERACFNCLARKKAAAVAAMLTDWRSM